ncbi:MAG: Glycerate 2-kinase [Candidatus Curtissbacteria bacterium GW2011_GWA1_40_16]|uniref:Glycerate 2-kinase n=1 Tax=Candidatus Curtissbacteria bacterium GW2011_GWA1_40_16 TaxID=1618405 RepID=A0A0G0RF47_9BACT|nr:MAG: Glycerate 2-kinase [Candidatus Curtissbacteria bacterium GW2011_GWA1_40_16]
MFKLNSNVGFIKNYQQLATGNGRKVALELIEAAFLSIQPEIVIGQNFSLQGGTLKIRDKTYELSAYEHIYLLGFGKGSARNSLLVEKALGENLSGGYVIDVSEEKFSKIEFTLGTHPLPSVANLEFTKKIIENLNRASEKDLVIVVTCGGGSVMLESPHNLSLEEMVNVNRELLHSGASIQEMNAIRKHLDIVKGGGLAQILFPAKVVNLIFSDVPGNDLSVIASGPTVGDSTTQQDAIGVIEKYGLGDKLGQIEKNFIESPKEDRYFENVDNILILSNDTALSAMQKKASELGLTASILTDSFQDEANLAGKQLVDATTPGSILLVGGETDVKVTGGGIGGRNQQLVLAALPYITEGTVLVSFDSDGWDNSEAAGAIGDLETVRKAKEKGLDAQKFLDENDSFTFFESTGDAILTGRLPSNVSDLMVVFKP